MATTDVGVRPTGIDPGLPCSTVALSVCQAEMSALSWAGIIESDQHGWSSATPKLVNCVSYFDPGDQHYKVCFEALFGTVEWNQCTVGDIVESLLGIQYRSKNNIEKFERLPDGFVKFIHDWCLAVYRYRQAVGWTVPSTDLFERIRHASTTVNIIVQ